MLKRDFFEGVRRTNWKVVTLAVLADSMLLVLAMRVALPIFAQTLPISQLSNGLITPTLIFSLARFLVVALLMLGLGGLKAADLGLAGRKLRQGAIVVAGLWLASQLIWAAYSLIAGQGIALSPIWRADNLLPIAGELLAQFGGNALAEEIIFRGFLLTQIYLLLKHRIESKVRLGWTALLVSQLIFAISHIPQRLLSGPEPLALALNLTMVMVVGVLFGLLYLRTGNLFIAIGLHALVNTPVTLLAPPSMAAASLAPLVMIVLLLLFWKQIERLLVAGSGKPAIGAPQSADPSAASPRRPT